MGLIVFVLSWRDMESQYFSAHLASQNDELCKTRRLSEGGA